MITLISRILRGCACTCGGCRGIHGTIDHCRIERFGCKP